MDVQSVRPFFILRLMCYWLMAIIFRPNYACVILLLVYLWRGICSCVYLSSFFYVVFQTSHAIDNHVTTDTA